ncbi:MAG: type II secretion system protein [Planctomycetes bacterium]|nr:type II secretion system protein [Planctomycetota bacterium]
MRHRRTSHCSAFTLVEMMAAMTVLSILVVGVSGTLVIASRAVDDGTAVNAQIPEARDVGDIIMADLSDALAFTERTVNAVTFTVPDRDKDGTEETIRYVWDGISGGTVTREYNGGAASVIADDVYGFDLTFLTRTVRPSPQACCYTDGTCADEVPDDCTSNGGAAMGSNSVCSTSDCSGI